MEKANFTTGNDAKSIFDYAEGFFAAYFILNTKVTPEERVKVVWALMTIAAFLSEMYLKCIISLETSKFPKGHHLYDLFSHVSPTTQTMLEQKWDAVAKSTSTFFDGVEKDLGHPLPRDLRSLLKMGSKGFEILRYAYEPGNAGFKFLLTDFPIVLRRTILVLQPTWGQQDGIPV